MGDSDLAGVADLLQIEKGEPLREQLAVDDPLVKTGDDPETHSAGQLAQRLPDPAVLFLQYLETLTKIAETGSHTFHIEGAPRLGAGPST